MKNGALAPDASGELDAIIHLRNGEAALAASGELKPPSMRGAPLACVFGGLYPTMRNGYAFVAFAGEFLQMNGGTGLAASFGRALRTRRGAALVAAAAASRPRSNRTGLAAFDGASPQSSDGLVGADGAFLWRSGELELGASGEASPRKSNEVGVLWPDDFDKRPLNIALVGRGDLLAAATAGVAMELNVTGVGGGDCEPVAAPDVA